MTQQVLEALIADPDVWGKTALFVMFDENDGYFDHLPPPCAPSCWIPGARTSPATSTIADATERHTDGNVIRPGPARADDRGLAVEPGRLGGLGGFDHPSLIRFVERRFGVAEPNISPGDAPCSEI